MNRTYEEIRYALERIVVSKVKGQALHCFRGPAVVWSLPTGSVWAEDWRRDGIRHRDDGPAWIQYNDDGSLWIEERHINGKRVESLT